MTTEIPRQDWKVFCDEISRDRLDWQTTVQVLSSESGAQVLSEGLPLIGLALERENGSDKIELMTGTGSSIHHTHSIFNPAKLLLQADSDKDGGILDIEDSYGTKTLISFIQPTAVPMVVERGRITQIS